MKKDILFLHPANHARTYQDLAHAFTAIAPPVWSALVAGFLHQRGFQVAIHDTNVHGWSTTLATELLTRHDPACVALMVYGNHPSASTQTMPAASAIATDLKKIAPDLPIIMGGGHPSALPELTLRQEKIYLVVHGEAAPALAQYLEHLHGKRTINQVQGISYLDGHSCYLRTEPAPIIEDLDESLSDYAWDLLPPLALYRAHNSHTMQYFQQSERDDFADVRSPYAILYSSVGCPHRCAYCCAHTAFGGRGLRTWSPETVVGWIDELTAKQQVKNIRFDDELFFSSPSRLDRLFTLLEERDYDLNLWGYARVDTVTEKLLKKMKRCGMNWLCLGIESADAAILQGVRKKTSAGSVVRAVSMLQDHGINVLGNFMFGLPGDTMESMEATLSLAMKLNCEFVNFYCTMPYPGSELFNSWRQQGPETLPETWHGYSQHGYEAKPLPTRHLTAAQVLAFRDRAFHRYFTGDSYLDMIAKKFGPRTVDHISHMTSIRLKRKLLADSSSDTQRATQ